MRQADWLAYYAERFDTVEVNATFYRLPEPAHVDRWREVTPPGFLFATKGSRYLTHVKRLVDPSAGVARFLELACRLGDKAGPVLWQLPPQMKRNDERLAAFAGGLPDGWRYAFEFRHESWFCQPVYDILTAAGAALCIPDHPRLPVELTLTTGWTYLRFHYGDQDGSYSDAALDAWAGRLGKLARRGIDVYAYFNNDQYGYAVENARRLREMLVMVC